MPKKVLKPVLGALLTAALLFVGYFYFKWFYADKEIPIPDALVGESLIGEGFETLEQDFNEALVRFQKDLEVPALSAAIYVAGKFAWAGAQGYADIENQTAATTRHKFRLGSTSKPFVAALAYKMEEQGKVDTSLPISTYLAGLPEEYQALTLKQLLSHTAGVRNYGSTFSAFPPNESYLNDQYNSAAEALEIFLDSPLQFTPREGFQYSAWGFVLASAVLEAAGGKDFPSLLEDELFKPIGLKNTMAEFSGREVSPLVALYYSSEGSYTATLPVNTSVKWAAGGLIATPENVARFGSFLLEGKILNEASLSALWTPVPLSDGSMNDDNYGQGFRIDTSVRLLGEDRPTQMYHHGGLVAGGSSFMMIVPEYGISVSVQTNTPEIAARRGAQNLAYELVRLVVDKLGPANKKPDFLTMDYIRGALQGNLQNMEAALAGKTETENDRILLEKFRARFIERSDGFDFGKEDPLVRRIGERFQKYWRDSLLEPAQREAHESELYADLKTILESEGVSVTEQFETEPDTFLTEVVEKRGYGAIFGRTIPLLDFMAWKTDETKVHDVELTDGTYSFPVHYLSDFVSLGWASFATFGGPSAGGWAKKEGLYVVTPRWDLDSEAFKVSYFMHEGRHFADFGIYPNLAQPDLEYRAKLTELAYAETDRLRILNMFTNHAARVDNSPHALANWYVITGMSQALLGADWPESPEVWETLPGGEIQAAAKKLLEAHNAALNAQGPEMATGVITP